MRLPGRELESLLEPYIPSDSARQAIAERYLEGATGHVAGRRWRVLDLGCGAGGSADQFRARDPEVDWIGLDVPGSPEARARARAPEDVRVETFDGVRIPFAEGSFDLVYCKQVLEHVREPAPLLAEVRRVLSPGGAFAGSTSQLEPFHSLSTWNYTPFGFSLLIAAAGMELVEVRPGIDALALIARRLLPRGGRPDQWFARWWGGQSPLNSAIDLYGRARGLDAHAVNATKLLFAGQFTFLARRPGE